jgi:hypothetical protein
VSGDHMARWSQRHRGQLVITSPDGDVVATLPACAGAFRPELKLLAGTGWAHYPGAEWTEEDSPGEWSIPVFRHPAPSHNMPSSEGPHDT